MLWLVGRILLVVAVVGLAAGWLGLGVWRRRQMASTARRALRAFDKNRGELAESFRAAAEATGKPRGLAWRGCDLAAGPPLLAYDRAARELVALAAATFSFEAVPGGGMEEVEAVGDLRDGVAVFAWRDGRWQTDGRAVFNHSPVQTLERFRDSLMAVE